jgi:hypothetical protein
MKPNVKLAECQACGVRRPRGEDHTPADCLSVALSRGDFAALSRVRSITGEGH